MTGAKNSSAAGREYWEGKWKTRSHKYLPLQIQKNGKRYNGWVELSCDTGSQKTILHKAAISKKEESAVRAGV